MSDDAISGGGRQMTSASSEEAILSLGRTINFILTIGFNDLKSIIRTE